MPLNFVKKYNSPEKGHQEVPKENHKEKEIRLTKEAFSLAEEKASKPDKQKISDLKQSFEGAIEENKEDELSDQDFIQLLQNMRNQLRGYHGGGHKTKKKRSHKRKTHRLRR